MKDDYQKMFEKYNKELAEISQNNAQKEYDLKKRYQTEIETLHADIDRLVIVRMKDKLETDSDLNQQIIVL